MLSKSALKSQGGWLPRVLATWEKGTEEDMDAISGLAKGLCHFSNVAQLRGFPGSPR